MNRIVFLMSVIIIFILPVTAHADWREDLENLLSSSTLETQTRYIKRIVRANPDWQDVIAAIQSAKFPVKDKGICVLLKTMCIDGVERPWVIYVPPSYDPSKHEFFLHLSSPQTVS